MEKKNEFTITLALVDVIPVIFFCIAAIAVAVKLNSVLILSGAILCIAAGLGKVLWKILLATIKRDIHALFTQMRVLMPAGFLLIIIGIVLKRSVIDWPLFLTKCVSFPAILVLVISIVALCGMIYMAKTLDPNNPKSNWIEQITNCIAQGAFMIWVLLIL